MYPTVFLEPTLNVVLKHIYLECRDRIKNEALWKKCPSAKGAKTRTFFEYHELFFAYLHQFPKSINFVDAFL